jgi:hypothetical protein
MTFWFWSLKSATFRILRVQIAKQSIARGFSKQIKEVILPLKQKYPLVYLVEFK